MSNKLPVNNGESRKLRKLLATGAVLLLLGACSDDKPGTALPMGTNLEHVDVSDKDAKATIYDRIQKEAETAAVQILDLVSKDKENDTAYSNIVRDKERPDYFNVTYEFGYENQVSGPSKFGAYLSLKKDAKGNLDPSTVDYVDIDNSHSRDIIDDPTAVNPWTETVFLTNRNSDWKMVNFTNAPILLTEDHPDGWAEKRGGSDIYQPKAELAGIEDDIARYFDVNLDSLVAHAPTVS